MHRANYPVDTHLTTGKYPYACLIFLGSFSESDIKVSSKQRGGLVYGAGGISQQPCKSSEKPYT